jgi:hypothetical protein
LRILVCSFLVIYNVCPIWSGLGKTYTVEVPADATVGELGKQLSQLTGVALHTMRLLVPQGRRVAAAALLPASEEHSSTTLKSSGIFTVPACFPLVNLYFFS